MKKSSPQSSPPRRAPADKFASGSHAKTSTTRLPPRNAVLLYFAPRTRKFGIVGDTAVHEKCGDAFWKSVAAQLTRDIHEMPMSEAVGAAIRTVGDLLAEHFPSEPGSKNELPDQIERD